MRLTLLLVTVFAIGATALPMTNRIESAGPPVPSGDQLKPMPAINLKDFNGKAINQEEFRDKVVLFDFWATWCAPCITEIPFLNRLHEKYANRGFKVVGVTLVSGNADEVKPFVSRLKMVYPVVMGDDDQAYELNIMAFPTSYLVTRDWKIHRRFIGAGPSKGQQMEAEISKLLDESPTN